MLVFRMFSSVAVFLVLQDVPFLATRLYILIVYELKHQMMIFFTGKNALVVILQVYRIIVLKVTKKLEISEKGGSICHYEWV